MLHRIPIALLFLAWSGLAAQSQAAAPFDAADPAVDPLVERCLAEDGVRMLPDSRTICYNAAIFPEQFLQLADFPDADRIIITSPGGNVATARMMSRILDQRGEPAVIAGQCMSACAMVILPGLDRVHIHRSAHIAVHGLTELDFGDWHGWLKDDERPGVSTIALARLGYNFDYMLYSAGKTHMKDHLEGQDVDLDYIRDISAMIERDARAHDCRVDPVNYWGMIDAPHLRRYLSDRITRIEAFAQSWDDPNNRVYKSITEPIGAKTYIFEDDYGDCE